MADQQTIQKAKTPHDAGMRERIATAAHKFVIDQGLLPPQPLDELRRYASQLLRALDVPNQYEGFASVMISNALWRDTVATVPFERRILLLPACFRRSDDCPAQIDEDSVLCKECGCCPIGQIQKRAETLGYIVLVTKNASMVTRLLGQGHTDAVIALNCPSSLEKAFPAMTADAVPSIAIPVVCDKDDSLDLAQIQSLIELKSEDAGGRSLHIEDLRREVQTWFERGYLQETVDWGKSKTEQVALDWLAGSGKRWRPFLATAAYQVTANRLGKEIPPEIKLIAAAVECFHKASLVHDDIEDEDDFRYGRPTLHCEFGVPFALNVGDFLLGEGYSLIARTGAPPNRLTRMMTVAAEGHRNLALGQGHELGWVRDPAPLTTREVIEIFQRKTSPAFGVALTLGAIYAGANDECCAVLSRFSKALGIAYQIQDDLSDFFGTDDPSDAEALRPSILLALAYEESRGEARRVVKKIWERQNGTIQHGEIQQIVRKLGIEDHARQLFKHYRSEAVRSLYPLRNAELKGLLYRLTGQILIGI